MVIQMHICSLYVYAHICIYTVSVGGGLCHSAHGSSVSTLFEVGSVLYCCKCQASWPAGFQSFSCLCLSSRFRNAGITGAAVAWAIHGLCVFIFAQALYPLSRLVGPVFIGLALTFLPLMWLSILSQVNYLRKTAASKSTLMPCVTTQSSAGRQECRTL